MAHSKAASVIYLARDLWMASGLEGHADRAAVHWVIKELWAGGDVLGPFHPSGVDPLIDKTSQRFTATGSSFYRDVFMLLVRAKLMFETQTIDSPDAQIVQVERLFKQIFDQHPWTTGANRTSRPQAHRPEFRERNERSWRLVFSGRSAELSLQRRSIGMTYIRELLGQPGVGVRASGLQSLEAEEASGPSRRRLETQGIDETSGDAEDLLSDESMRKMRARLTALKKERGEAENNSDRAALTRGRPRD